MSTVSVGDARVKITLSIQKRTMYNIIQTGFSVTKWIKGKGCTVTTRMGEISVTVHVCVLVALEYVCMFMCSAKQIFILVFCVLMCACVCRPAEGNISQHSDGVIVMTPMPQRRERNQRLSFGEKKGGRFKTWIGGECANQKSAKLSRHM